MCYGGTDPANCVPNKNLRKVPDKRPRSGIFRCRENKTLTRKGKIVRPDITIKFGKRAFFKGEFVVNAFNVRIAYRVTQLGISAEHHKIIMALVSAGF